MIFSVFFTSTLAPASVDFRVCYNCTIQSDLEQKSSETGTAKTKNIFCLDFTVCRKFVFAAAVYKWNTDVYLCDTTEI